MGKAIGNTSGAVVLAGVGLAFPQGLFQSGIAGLVLGVNGHIINPASAAVGGVGAVHGGHGQGDQEGISGGHNIFRNLGFHDKI